MNIRRRIDSFHPLRQQNVEGTKMPRSYRAHRTGSTLFLSSLSSSFLKDWFLNVIFSQLCFLYFPNDYGPCHPLTFFSKRSGPRVQDYSELWVCEGRRPRVASRPLHSPLVTNAAHFPPSFLLPPVRFSAPSSGTSSIRVKIRTANQSARLEFFDLAPRLRVPRVYTWIAPYVFVIRAVWAIWNYD